MAELIQTIILSSGTVIKIPIFPVLDRYPERDEFTRYSRGDVGIIDYLGSVRKWQRCSDDDLIELGNILTNGNYEALNIEIPQTAGRWCGCIYWFWDSAGQEWKLATCFTNTGVLNVHLVNFRPNEEAPYFYYDNENPNATGDNQSFTYRYTHANPSFGLRFYNLRSGPIYTLDIATNIDIGGLSHAMSLATVANNVSTWATAHPTWPGTIIAYDPESNDDPYIVDDPSSFDGGGGAREDPDEIDKATIPALPSVSAVDTGLITMYGATLSQLQALGSYLWSDLWDIETNFKKLFADPMNCLIGLSIVPVTPSMGGAANVKFGNITTNIALNKLTSQWAEVDCGSVSIKEYIGSFLDYSPYVNISIYLPYIGYRELSPDDVMNDTIHVVYHIDVLTGGCCAFIETGKKGLLYSFNGSCIADVPITAINYSGAIQNAVSAVGSMAMTGVGIATGAAPVAAMGAASMLTSAANTAVNSKPTVQRSGNMGGSAGLMSYQKPMLVITRPRMSVPDKLNKFAGLTTNVTMNLSQCKGFTQVEFIHLANVPCTDNERDELLTLLRQGVIF